MFSLIYNLQSNIIITLTLFDKLYMINLYVASGARIKINNIGIMYNAYIFLSSLP